MRQFAALYHQLDASTATLAKVGALRVYFAAAPAEDAAWATWFLAGGKPRQLVPTALLRGLACRLAGIDDWLFEECYQTVGDLAETIAHVLPPGSATREVGLAHWVEQRLLPLRGLPPAEQLDRVAADWAELDAAGRFLYVKLIGGGFRVGVSRLLVQRALAEHAGLDPKLLAQRMMGWTDARATPTPARWQALLAPDSGAPMEAGQPYPFFLAQSLQVADAEVDAALGPAEEWLVEWKYDGIRAQLVRRAGQVWIWSRGEELVTDRFPELATAALALPDGCVLDGEILAWQPGTPQPAPFNLLQQRIARKTLTRKVLADAPVRFVAYDLLEHAGQDVRAQAQQQRRDALDALVAALGDEGQGARAVIDASPLVAADGWAGRAALRATSRQRGVEGFMLKHRASPYGIGRRKLEVAHEPGASLDQAAGPASTAAGWWKWKIDPLSVDAVLIYAQAGHGRRANVYTDYTFAVWSRPPADAAQALAVVEAIARREPAVEGTLQLVPFAKAYSGLSDAEFKAVDRVIRANTLEKFGPVRSVRPTLVFEIGFEGINRSGRHKSGIAVRFPRMLRIRQDKPLHEADSLGVLERLLGGG
jgi:DNA ligase 1